MSVLFSKYNKNYEINYVKSVFSSDLGIFYRKVEPMIVSVCIGIILNEQSISIGLLFVFKSTQ